jgi:hypothetical protein
MTSENDPKEALEREVYWAETATPVSNASHGDIRDLLRDFAMQVRADEKQAVPLGEPNIASPSKLRREAKAFQFRLFRPIRRRNDRLTAELAELTGALADRVLGLEAEVRQLKAELEGRS